MPDAFTYPGVYVQELPGGVHTVTGVSTSVTAFIDQFARGPMNTAVEVTSWAAFQANFGGLSATSEASYAVQQFFMNGGSTAWIVRVVGSAATPVQATATATLKKGATAVLTVSAWGAGAWASKSVQVVATVSPSDATRFNLLVQQLGAGGNGAAVVARESYSGLSMTPADPAYAPTVVNAASQLVRLADDGAGTLPDLTTPDKFTGIPAAAWTSLDGGVDGPPIDRTSILGDGSGTGIWALDRIAPSIFNLLCVPAIATVGLATADYTALVTSLEAFCTARRAFLILDAPSTVTTESAMASFIAAAGIASPNAAIYFPGLQMPDALKGGQLRQVGASGTVAGLFAATDASRGVWKACAGVNATVAGAVLQTGLTDAEQGLLNPLGVNCLRSFPLFGTVVWGARTLAGADALASPWKYVPVRRTALYIEESLYEGMRWAVFEPNDETLWSQLRAAADDFMAEMFRAGAFQGTTPDQAYLVKCDAETTTQGDIDRGVVNLLVGFAPLKPAEFVVLQIEQLAGQGGT